LQTLQEIDMRKIGITFVVTMALASSAAWAQQTGGQSAARGQVNMGFDSASMGNQATGRTDGSQKARGVVTGGSGDGGIALQSDAAKAGTNVPAISGGVSLNARDNLRTQEKDANVKLVFALNTGNYVSDVQVKVVDSKGKTVIDDVSNGPWVLAKLPAGSYTATATYNGKTVTQKFTAGKSGLRTAHFRWPASVENVGAADAEAAGVQILGTGPQEPQR
jgi:hypothetical protein